MSSSILYRRRSAQSGAVLVTGLVFLVVLTMFVLALVRSGTLEERMARNARDLQVAREAAEAVLRDAETTVFSRAPFDPFDADAFTTGCTNGLCFRPAADKGWDKIDWKSTALTRTFNLASSNMTEVADQPRYVVELLKAPVKPSSAAQCSTGLARVTARGQGRDGAVSVIQSTVRFRSFSSKC